MENKLSGVQSRDKAVYTLRYFDSRGKRSDVVAKYDGTDVYGAEVLSVFSFVVRTPDPDSKLKDDRTSTDDLLIRLSSMKPPLVGRSAPGKNGEIRKACKLT